MGTLSLNKAFKRLAAKTDQYDNGLCRRHHTQLSIRDWQHYLANREGCVLCQQVYTLLERDAQDASVVGGFSVYLPDYYHVEVHLRPDREKKHWSWEDWLKSGRDQVSKLSVELWYDDETEGSALVKRRSIHSKTAEHDLLVHDSRNASVVFNEPRLPDAHTVDFGLIQEWMRHCEHEHGDECTVHPWKRHESNRGQSRSSNRLPFRLIDVENDSLVPAPSSCRYLTLTYVWGKCQPPHLNSRDAKNLAKRDGLVPFYQDMPRTIRDAIKLTRKIQERYIWIDQVCIFQNDPHDKEEQLRLMDQIYQNSVLTVIALSGDSAASGLAGVSSRKGEKSRRQVASTLDGRIHFFIPNLDTPKLADWRWNSRAWCYQEKILSNRFLGFFEDQVFWHCRRQTWTDQMYEHVDTSNLSGPLSPLQLIEFSHTTTQGGRIQGGIEKRRDGTYCAVRSGGFYTYVSAVVDYTNRALTVPNDRLKGFLGVLKLLAPHVGGSLIYGLPERTLDVALLWRSEEPMARTLREGPHEPSWSWAGWIGPVTWEEPYVLHENETRPVGENESHEERVRSMITWYRGDEDSQSYQLVNQHGVGIDAAVLSGRKVAFPDFTFQTLSEEECHLAPISPQYLRFWADHAILTVSSGQPISYIVAARDESRSRDASPRDSYEESTGYSVVGYVIFTAEQAYHATIDVEMIAISEAQFFGQMYDCYGEWDPQLGFEHGYYELLNVLCVRRIRANVCERIGIGRVVKEAWAEASPRAELTTLG